MGSTLVALPLAAGLAYAFARYGTGGSSLRLAVLASGCDWFEDPRPSDARLVVEGEAGKEVRLAIR